MHGLAALHRTRQAFQALRICNHGMELIYTTSAVYTAYQHLVCQ